MIPVCGRIRAQESEQGGGVRTGRRSQDGAEESRRPKIRIRSAVTKSVMPVMNDEKISGEVSRGHRGIKQALSADQIVTRRQRPQRVKFWVQNWTAELGTGEQPIRAPTGIQHPPMWCDKENRIERLKIGMSDSAMEGCERLLLECGL